MVGIAKSAEAARAGRIAGRSVLWIVIVCTASAIFGALMIVLLTHAVPAAARDRGRRCRRRSPGSSRRRPAPMPGVADFFKGVIPDNVFAAASNGDVLPLVVFAVLFALALARIAAAGRRTLVGLFEADRRRAAGDHRLGAVDRAAGRVRAGLHRRRRRPAARRSPASAIMSC